VTGSFFPLTTEPARPGNGVAQQPVTPSLDCAYAKNSDEEEICADPDLAVLDTRLAQTYRDAVRRLEAKLASQLREDERSWARESPGFYEQKLNPYYDKLIAAVHHTSDARDELRVRLEQRVAMIANLDEHRRGFEGLWVSHNAVLEIKREPDQPPGTLRVFGVKDEVGGDTLVIEEQRGYCTRDLSSGARLFPVKAGLMLPGYPFGRLLRPP
jgi:hypothetical protein